MKECPVVLLLDLCYYPESPANGSHWRRTTVAVVKLTSFGLFSKSHVNVVAPIELFSSGRCVCERSVRPCL